jgi:hypothetical protein
MFTEIRMAAVFSVLAVSTLGCAGTREVRYVYQDGQSGVIGLPENTSQWPTYYRKHAEELMAKHFPEGYEVVRAEEVEEGSRTLTVKGTHAAELDAAGPGKVLSVAKVGRTSSRTQSDTMKLKECRIVYKKAEPKPAAHMDYAEQASWTPSSYVDPNAPVREHGEAKVPGSKSDLHKVEAAKSVGAPRQAEAPPVLDEPPFVPLAPSQPTTKPAPSESTLPVGLDVAFEV